MNSDYPVPDPDAPSAYQRDIYSNFRDPSISTKPAEWEALARAKVPKANFGYVYGAASSGSTHANNTAAFNRYRLRPHMLVNATKRDLSVELFGESPCIVERDSEQRVRVKEVSGSKTPNRLVRSLIVSERRFPQI